MKEKTSLIVEKALASKVKEMGLELFEVTFAKKQNGMNLTLFLTKKNGAVTIQDCEKVHRMADEVLDDLNPTKDQPYILNVSSLGLDRALSTDKDFNHFLNNLLEISFFKPMFGEKKIVGKLLAFDKEKIVVENENFKEKTVEILRRDIAGCKVFIQI